MHVAGAGEKLRTRACEACMCAHRTVTCSCSLSALTTLTPTPCRPPDTLYPLPCPPNLPPACSTVSTVSSALLPVAGCVAVGMPRPSSEMVTHPVARSSSTWHQRQHLRSWSLITATQSTLVHLLRLRRVWLPRLRVMWCKEGGMQTLTVVACPPCTSSMALSRISYT